MGMSSSEQMKWEGQEQYIFWVLQTDKDCALAARKVHTGNHWWIWEVSNEYAEPAWWREAIWHHDTKSVLTLQADDAMAALKANSKLVLREEMMLRDSILKESLGALSPIRMLWHCCHFRMLQYFHCNFCIKKNHLSIEGLYGWAATYA